MSDTTQFMREAVELSRLGFPAPNPHVGCVVVKGGKVVGRGFHDHAGGPHAERVALLEAGPLSQGADVYVTLEPCNHHGRTAPCAQALADAGVARVFIAVADPNPRAKGGADHLASKGVQVSVGMMAEEAEAENEPFLTAMRRGRPFVVAKVAMSLDGRVALPNGQSKWITGEAARSEGNRLRSVYGAVLVGRNTVARDEPRLTARHDQVVNQPVRIILDPNSALTGIERVFGPEAPTWHVVKNPVREGQRKAPMDGEGIDLEQLLRELFDEGVTSILVEGGPITLGHFLKRRLIDRLEVFLAPKVLGEGISWVQIPISDLADAHRFEMVRSVPVGDDLWLSYRPVS